MSTSATDAGIIQALVQRLEEQRLPHALSLKDKVDSGETLSNYDISFLDQVFKDAQQIMPLLERHPEWQDIATKVIHLYKEVTDKALENEKPGGV